MPVERGPSNEIRDVDEGPHGARRLIRSAASTRMPLISDMPRRTGDAVVSARQYGASGRVAPRGWGPADGDRPNWVRIGPKPCYDKCIAISWMLSLHSRRWFSATTSK